MLCVSQALASNWATGGPARVHRAGKARSHELLAQALLLSQGVGFGWLLQPALRPALLQQQLWWLVGAVNTGLKGLDLR